MDDSESNPEEVPDMVASLSTVALEGMDPDSSNELDMDRTNCSKLSGSGPNIICEKKWRKSMGTGSGVQKASEQHEVGTCISSSRLASRGYIVHIQSASSSGQMGCSL